MIIRQTRLRRQAEPLVHHVFFLICGMLIRQEVLKMSMPEISLELTAHPLRLIMRLRPTDMNVLGLADVFITVTNFTANSTVRIVGTEEYGAAQTEDIAITGNGTYNSTKYWKTIATTQVTVFGGNFTYTLTQGQWGVVWKTGSRQFMFDCFLVTGDGATATTFSDTDKAATFSNVPVSANYQALFTINKATVTFGVLEDGTKLTTSRGCLIQKTDAYVTQLFKLQTTDSYLNLYSSLLEDTNTLNTYMGGSVDCTVTLYNTTLCGVELWNASAIYVLSRVNIQKNINLYGLDQCTGTFNDIFISECNYAIYAFPNTYTNLKARNSITKTFLVAAGVTAYLVNPDVDAFTFAWSGAFTFYRQYTFDLKVTDKDNNPLANATVALRNNVGALIFSVLTNASGDIVTQTVSRGYYTQATGDILQDYSPHALTITRAGYQTYHKHFTLSAKTTWEIKLAQISQILLDQGKPVLNIVPTDPENKQILTL